MCLFFSVHVECSRVFSFLQEETVPCAPDSSVDMNLSDAMSVPGLAVHDEAFTEAMEEELFFQDDPIVEDPVEAALDRDLDRWLEQKYEPLVSDVPVQCFSGGSAASSSSSILRPLSERLAGVRQTLGKNFKYGHCPTCSVALRPIVHKSGHNWGRPFLRCGNWWKYKDEKRLCWYGVRFRGDVCTLPKSIRSEIERMQSHIHWQLKNGKPDRAT